jgi:hypothetical protein
MAVYPRPSNLSYPTPVLSMGSCFRSRSKVGKDGVSAGGQRTQALADLFVFGGQSAHFRQILPLLLTPTPIVRTLHRRRRWARTPGVHPLAPRNKQKLAGRGKTLAGGLRIAYLIYQDALRRPPVFPQCKQWPDAKAGVARGKHTRVFEIIMKLRTAVSPPSTTHRTRGRERSASQPRYST